MFESIASKLAGVVRGSDDAGTGERLATEASVAAILARTPAAGGLTDAQLRATAVSVSFTWAGLTDAQLRATPVPVSGPLTDTQLRAAAVPVSGPLTDTQLRAVAVPVSGTFFQATQPVSAAALPLPAGAATETSLAALLALHKAEDSVAANADLGVPVLTVRRLADTPTTDADGDYAPLITNEEGRLKVSTKPGGYAPTTGNITAAAQTVSLDVSRVSNIMVYMVAAALVGHKVAFEGSLDNTNWFAVNAVRSDSGIVETASDTLAASPIYAWECSVNGCNWFRVRATAHTSGTAAYTLQPGAYATEPVPTTISPSAPSFFYNQAGVVPINTVLIGPVDCIAAQGVYLHVASIGTTGQIQVQWSSDSVSWTVADVRSYAGLAVTSITAANFYQAPAYARYCRVILTVATTAGTTTLGLRLTAQAPNPYIQAVDTELAAVASADALGNPTIPNVLSYGIKYNGATWDRDRSNFGISVEASSAKTATGQSAAAITNFNARGAAFIVNVSAVTGTTPTMTVKLQVQDVVSANWVDVPGAVTASITAAGTFMLTVYPGLVEAANSKVSFPLPRTYRFLWTIGGTTPSFTFSIGAHYIN
jgi:hypothetical protein